MQFVNVGVAGDCLCFVFVLDKGDGTLVIGNDRLQFMDLHFVLLNYSCEFMYLVVAVVVFLLQFVDGVPVLCILFFDVTVLVVSVVDLQCHLLYLLAQVYVIVLQLPYLPTVLLYPAFALFLRCLQLVLPHAHAIVLPLLLLLQRTHLLFALIHLPTLHLQLLCFSLQLFLDLTQLGLLLFLILFVCLGYCLLFPVDGLYFIEVGFQLMVGDLYLLLEGSTSFHQLCVYVYLLRMLNLDVAYLLCQFFNLIETAVVLVFVVVDFLLVFIVLFLAHILFIVEFPLQLLYLHPHALYHFLITGHHTLNFPYFLIDVPDHHLLVFDIALPFMQLPCTFLQLVFKL